MPTEYVVDLLVGAGVANELAPATIYRGALVLHSIIRWLNELRDTP